MLASSAMGSMVGGKFDTWISTECVARHLRDSCSMYYVQIRYKNNLLDEYKNFFSERKLLLAVQWAQAGDQYISS